MCFFSLMMRAADEALSSQNIDISSLILPKTLHHEGNHERHRSSSVNNLASTFSPPATIGGKRGIGGLDLYF